MTTQPTTTTRFRHIDADDVIYVGTAEITEDTADWGEPTTDVTILDCWRFGTTVEEVFPYSKAFPVQLRLDIIQTALEQRMTPPVCKVELPTDWEEIEILDVSTRYILRHEGPTLPLVETPFQRDMFGLKAIQDIYPNKDGYIVVVAKGGIADVMSELHRLRTA